MISFYVNRLVWANRRAKITHCADSPRTGNKRISQAEIAFHTNFFEWLRNRLNFPSHRFFWISNWPQKFLRTNFDTFAATRTEVGSKNQFAFLRGVVEKYNHSLEPNQQRAEFVVTISIRTFINKKWRRC